MFNPSDYVAISFVILLCYFYYKNFFGFNIFLEQGLHDIHQKISDAENLRLSAQKKLHDVREKMRLLEPAIEKIQEQNQRAIEMMMDNKEVEIKLLQEQLEIKHASNMKHLEEELTRLHDVNLVSYIIEKTFMRLQNDAKQKALNISMDSFYFFLSTFKKSSVKEGLLDDQ